MRDRQAIYAATPASDLAAQWKVVAIVGALGAWTSWVFWPDSAAVGVGLLVAAVAAGGGWAFVMPPRPREKGDQPWLLAVGTAVVLVLVALLTGPYVLSLANVALASYLATFALSVTLHHRRHPTPVAR
jgi:hypothetical protein